MNPLEQLARAPAAAIEFSNVLLTTDDAAIGQSPKDIVWTHRKATLYRYRSDNRTHPIPVLLVFALINRPDIFDLRPGHSFVEFLLEEGFDVFLLDWGRPDDEDADMGLDDYVCDQLHWGVRETLRASGEDELSLLGWCIGGTFCAMYAALEPDSGVRNLVLLTTTIDTTHSHYAPWVSRDSFDVDQIAETLPAVPGRSIDVMNKMLKPVNNYWTTYRKLWENVLEADGDPRRSYQPMAKWVSDNPDFAGRAFREWITWLYKENRLVNGGLRLRGRLVDLSRIEHNMLVITAGKDHITRRPETMPLFDMVSSEDVTHLDRPGGHIGLMAGSKARDEIWPDIAEWLEQRSQR
ncbi:MAG: alpha/beta fold hydrolase [Actinomycetota bacterium]|nr:alpha/beta fold hydrolase [Actinomycetota bacterium]